MRAQLLSHVRLFVTRWTVTRQALLFMGFPRQEYWSGLPFPAPGDLPDPGIEPTTPALAAGFFTTSTTWEAQLKAYVHTKACTWMFFFITFISLFSQLKFFKFLIAV